MGFQSRKFYLVLCVLCVCLLQAFASVANATILYGVDVSKWQYSINWSSVKSAVDFAIIRSSYGSDGYDDYFTANQSAARSVGILRGYYHFAYPYYNTPEEEANHFVSVVGTLQRGEIMCLDYEPGDNVKENTSISTIDWCKRFLDRVYSLTGVKPYLYTYYYFEKTHDWASIVNAGYPLWLADYDGIANFTTPTSYIDWPSVTMKQYTSSGSVSGISGRSDMDIFNGTATQFAALGYQPDPPVLKITNPTTASTYTTSSSSIVLRGSASSAVGVSNVTWTNSNGGSGTCSGTLAWSTGSIPLQVGTNLITIKATDTFSRSTSVKISVTYTLPTVTGTITLQNLNGSPAGYTLNVAFRKSDGTTSYYATTLDSSGNFTVKNVAPGTYNIAFKAGHWLQKVVSSITIYSNYSGIRASLVNGDVNGDNVVNAADYTAMRAAWNTTSSSSKWNANADLNGDGRVNMGDYNILKKNWNISGNN